MKQPKNPILLLVLACVAIFFVNLNVWHVNIMEARNFISAREMLTDGNWLLPTLNGQPRYQKPPFPTWLTAISGAIFGIKSLAAMRLPAAIMALLLVLTTYKFTFRFVQNKSYALTAALVLASSFLVIFSGRSGQWDIFAYTFMTLAIYQLYLFFTEKDKHIKYVILASVFIGLSGMSKGPVAIYALLIPFLISYGIVFKFGGLSKRWMGSLFIAILGGILASSWYVYACSNDPETFLTITQRETFNWTHKNIRPFYHYWSFFLQSGIWALTALIGLLYPYLKNKVINKKVYSFTLLWTIIAVLFLSIIPEKKSRYILPVMIPLALNTSFYLVYLFKNFKSIKDFRERLPVYFNFGLIGFIGLAFPIAGYFYLKDSLIGHWFWFALLSICLFGIGVFILRKLAQKNIQTVFYGSIGMICAIMVFGMPLSKLVIANPAYKPLSEISVWQSNTKRNVYEYAVISVEMVWDYGEKISVIKRDEAITIPKGSSFGVLVSKEQQASFLETFKDFSIEKIMRYDMNSAAVGTKSHRTRLWRDLYLVRRITPE